MNGLWARPARVAGMILAAPLAGAAGCGVADGPFRRPSGDVGADRVAWHIAYSAGTFAPTVGTEGGRAYARTGVRQLTAYDLATRRKLWDALSGEADADQLFQAPNVLATGGLAVFGAYRGLTAVDGATGQRRWYWEPSRGGVVGQGSPVVTSDALVYAATRQPAMLYAVDLATGREQWATALATDLTSAQTASDPAAGRDVVVVTVRVEDRGVTPSIERGSVVALDAATGRERWRFAVPPLADGRRAWNWNGGLAVDPAAGVAVATAGDDGRIFGLDLADGRARWQAPGVVAYDIRPVAITGGVALAGSTVGPLVAYDVATGRERWRGERDATRTGSRDERFAAADGTFYIVGRGAGGVFAHDSQTGALRWRYAPAYTPSNTGLPYSPVAVWGDYVLATAVDGLYAVRR